MSNIDTSNIDAPLNLKVKNKKGLRIGGTLILMRDWLYFRIWLVIEEKTLMYWLLQTERGEKMRNLWRKSNYIITWVDKHLSIYIPGCINIMPYIHLIICTWSYIHLSIYSPEHIDTWPYKYLILSTPDHINTQPHEHLSI